MNEEFDELMAGMLENMNDVSDNMSSETQQQKYIKNNQNWINQWKIRGEKTPNTVNQIIEKRITSNPDLFNYDLIEKPKLKFNTRYWLKQAQKFNPNFRSIEEVKQWQRKNGLFDDGKFGRKSEEMWKKLNSNKSKKNTTIISSNQSNTPKLKNEKSEQPQYSLNVKNPYDPNFLRNSITVNPKVNYIEQYQDNLRKWNEIQRALFELTTGEEYPENIIKKQNSQYPDSILFNYQLLPYHQQGGTMANNEQELQKAFMAFLIEDAAAQGVKIQSEEDLKAYAQQLGKEGLQAKYQEFMQRMQGGVKAKLGAKLDYIRKIKGLCAEDEELVYMKKGGRMCPVCEKKKKAMKAEEGEKLDAVKEFKCGRKIKKAAGGEKVPVGSKKPIKVINTPKGTYKKYDRGEFGYDYVTPTDSVSENVNGLDKKAIMRLNKAEKEFNAAEKRYGKK